MKMNWSILLSLLAGVGSGALAATTLVANHYNRLFDGWYLMGVAEQAHIAHQIKTGQGGRLAAGIETSLPGYVLTIESQYGLSGRALRGVVTGGGRDRAGFGGCGARCRPAPLPPGR
jgi:hypothetical protein